jgi:hypothetical protein
MAVIKGGRFIARNPRRQSTLAITGRPETLDHARYAPAAAH